MPVFHSLKGVNTKIACHSNPKGIIQFIGAFVFGSCPERSYRYLFQQLYACGYSIVIYRFPFQPLQFKHWPVAIHLLEESYQTRVKIIEHLRDINSTDQLDFYAQASNYFWLGHSLGCKYILLLEILSNLPKKRNNVLSSCLRSTFLSEVNDGIDRADSARECAERTINEIFGESYQFSSFIRDQPSLLLAPEINNTVQVFNQTPRLSSNLGFPSRCETQCLISSSTDIFKLMGLISFNLDILARDDVTFLKKELEDRGGLPFLHEALWGWHLEPLGVQVKTLVDRIDTIFQELQRR